jgi:hypothetical protein
MVGNTLEESRLKILHGVAHQCARNGTPYSATTYDSSRKDALCKNQQSPDPHDLVFEKQRVTELNSPDPQPPNNLSPWKQLVALREIVMFSLSNLSPSGKSCHFQFLPPSLYRLEFTRRGGPSPFPPWRRPQPLVLYKPGHHNLPVFCPSLLNADMNTDTVLMRTLYVGLSSLIFVVQVEQTPSCHKVETVR